MNDTQETSPNTEEQSLREKIGLALYWESRPESWSPSMIDSIESVFKLIETEKREAYRQGGIDELKTINDPLNAFVYREGLVPVVYRIAELTGLTKEDK